jgi:hypothetical protein
VTSGTTLLVSAHNEAAGGVLAVDASGAVPIDRLSTRGLAVRGDRVYRVVSAQDGARPASDLLVYDAAGLRSFHRLDGVWDVHDVLPRAHDVLVVSSSDAVVYALREDGELVPWWDGEGDPTRYVNCLCEADGEVFATEFGGYDARRRRDVDAPSGRLFHVLSGRTAISGLRQPHDPRRIDGGWVVCDSRSRELRAYDDGGTLRRSRRLAGFTRGLAIGDEHIYVGESVGHDVSFGELARARISVLDRSTWEPVAAIDLDVPEIYAIDIASPGALAGLRAAAQLPSAPPHRWLVSDPLEAADLVAVVRTTLPAAMRVRSAVTLPCRVTNHGRAHLVSAAPNPVHLCYRWFDAADRPVDEHAWIHTDLPRALEPGAEAAAAMRITAPPEPGTYTLAITLLQEGVAWFDDIDPENGVSGVVEVEAG